MQAAISIDAFYFGISLVHGPNISSESIDPVLGVMRMSASCLTTISLYRI